MLETLLKAIGVITMTDQQRTLLAQKDAIQQAANRLLAVVAEIEADYKDLPSWANVDRHWRWMDHAEAINDEQ